MRFRFQLRCSAVSRCARCVVALVIAGTVWSAGAQQVLLLWDDAPDQVAVMPPAPEDLNENTQSLIAALEEAGMVVTLSERTQYEYDGRSPAPDGFDAVIFLNGNTASALDVMPANSVVTLQIYVRNNGGAFITSENTESQISIPFVGLSKSMEELMVLDREVGPPPAYGELTLNAVPENAGHPVLAGLPESFTFTGGAMRSVLRSYESDPATLLMTDGDGNAAVGVRAYGQGRVVSMHHTGNYRSTGEFSTTLQDPEIQQLYINGIRWADKTPPLVASITRVDAAPVDGLARYRVIFREGVTGVDATDFVAVPSSGVTVSDTLFFNPLSAREYIVGIQGLSGTGTLRLDFVDDDTVRDLSDSQNVLGGEGEGNGDFAGASYLVDATIPQITSFSATPSVVPVGSPVQLSFNFDEPMDLEVFPTVNLVTVDNGVILASPMGTSAGGPRVTENVLALYDFAEGSGAVVRDISGVGTPLDLTIGDTNNIQWLDGALAVTGSNVISTFSPADKVNDGIVGANAVTLEAWIRTDDLGQSGPARVVSLSQGTGERNLTLGQETSRYEVRLRTTDTTTNGIPAVSTATNVVTNALQHVVYTRGNDGAVAVYVDSLPVQTATIGGNLSNWDGDYELILANEFTQNRPWIGEFHLVALYDKALTPTEVQQNFDAGPVVEMETGGDGAWVGSQTYRVSSDRLVVAEDKGSARVEISGAQDPQGNTMSPNSSFSVVLVGGIEVTMVPRGKKFVEEGTDITLTLFVSGGVGPLSYEWIREDPTGMMFPVGFSAPTLVLSNLSLADSGRYFCRVSDGTETVESESLQLEVVDQLSVGSPWLLFGLSLFTALAGVLVLNTPRGGQSRRRC